MKLEIRGALALAACCCFVYSEAAQAQRQNPYRTASDAADRAGDSFVSYNDDGYDYNNLEPVGYNGSAVGGSAIGGGYGGGRGGGLGLGLGEGLGNRSMQFFAGAQYIYARASFSEAPAYMVQTVPGGEEFVEHDFNYQSSYGFYGGVQFPDCGSAIVFNFQRLRSDSSFDLQDSDFPAGTNVRSPYEVDLTAGGRLQGSADVDLKSYDISFQKTIPLGSPLGCCDSGCDTCCDTSCDTCCDSGCGNWCPAWDITWSAGLRYADVNWSRGSTATDNAQVFLDSSNTRLTFDGIGARVGLAGRRYFGRSGRFSLFARGDWSLLVGDMNIDTTLQQGTLPSAYIRSSGRRVIPVTEIEAGGTLQVRDNIQISSGYFISAWQDLGMRDTYTYGGISELSSYDDANILGFDGFFVRAQISF